MTFKIESGVPMPSLYMRRGYPFADMNVGDSFFVKGTGEIRGLRNAVDHWVKAHPGPKFVCRAVEENGESGARIWRVS